MSEQTSLTDIKASIPIRRGQVIRRKAPKNIPESKSVKWVRDKIKCKHCVQFVEGRVKDVCNCGDKKIDHAGEGLDQINSVTQFVDIPTNAYGQIDFKGTTRRAKAKFVKLSNESDPLVIFEMVTKLWKLEQPRLLISVTGGAKSFNMDPRLKELFAAGLLKLAETPGAWVITGGTNTGVMKHVGEALQGATKACIGITTWGIVSQREALLEKPFTKPLGGKFSYTVASSLVESGAFLDHNHTHFLLVDDGSDGKFGREIDFRTKFEKHIMKNICGTVPSVLLVLEGGPGTLDTVVSAISEEVPTPVVIIKDSGRSADVIAFAITNVEGDVDCYYEENSRHAGLVSCIGKIFPELKPEGQLVVYEKVLKCVKKERSFTVFQMGSGADLDEAILKALLSSQATSPFDQLQLTLLWNRADLAEESILSQQNCWEQKDLTNAMLMSLALDRVDFVRTLLGYGININSVLTHKRLEFLYGYRSRSGQSSLIYKLRDDNEYQSTANNTIDADVIQLLCSYEGYDYKSISLPRNSIRRIVKDLCCNLIRQGNEEFIQNSEAEDGSEIFIYPFRELFIWAVLNNMQEMAMYLLEFEEEGMAKALIGAEINNSYVLLGDKHDLPEEGQKEFQANAQEFRNLSVQLLEECFKMDESKTERVITAESYQFAPHTCLSLAVASNHMEFVSHSSVQMLLSDVWTGAIKQTDLTSRELLLGIFFPPYLYTFDFRTKSELEKMVSAKDLDEDIDDDDDDGVGTQQETSLTTKDEQSSTLHLVQTDQPSYESIPLDKRKQETEADLPFLSMCNEFYFKTPVIKFYTYVMAYFVFLGLFAYVAMLKKDRKKIQFSECVLIAFVGSLTIEEIRQVLSNDGPTVRRKFQEWIENSWNRLDALAIIVFFVALGLRLHNDTAHVGHILYAIDAGLWILRLLHVFFAHKILGPYVVMIGRMFIDMMYFLVILFVFLLAYGVSTKAILQPQESGWMMFRDVIFHPYFNIYGELFIDRDAADNKTTRFGTPVINDYAEPLAWIFLGFYLLIANVLLLNLLIAIFNNTFTKVQENSAQIWKCQRYQLITEYASRPPLVPPFIILSHIYISVQWMLLKCCPGCKKIFGDSTSGVKHLKSNVTDDERDDLLEFENDCMASFLRKKSPYSVMSTEELTRDLLEQVENLNTKFCAYEEKLKQIDIQAK